jgi:hypothetical protein
MAQLKSTIVQGALTVTGNVVANKLIKTGGTASQILMADGSVKGIGDLISIPGISITDTGTKPIVGDITASGHTVTVTRIGLDDLGLASAYKYKGSVTKYENLPTTNNVIGDVWNVTDTGMNYAWTGTAWDPLGATVDISNFVTLNTEQTITAKKTFDAPANASGEQATTVFKTANGGSITIGKEGSNSGTMLRFDQTHGVCRLRFRASSSPGTMVWEQPESNSTLCLDVSNVDFRNTTGIKLSNFKSAGYLYTDSNGNLKSAAFPSIPTVNNGTLTLSTSGTGVSGSATFTANQSTASTFTVTLDSSAAGNRGANKVVLAKAAGRIDSDKFTVTSAGTTKSTIQYNTTEGCLEFVFA